MNYRQPLATRPANTINVHLSTRHLSMRQSPAHSSHSMGRQLQRSSWHQGDRLVRRRARQVIVLDESAAPSSEAPTNTTNAVLQTNADENKEVEEKYYVGSFYPLRQVPGPTFRMMVVDALYDEHFYRQEHNYRYDRNPSEQVDLVMKNLRLADKIAESQELTRMYKKQIAILKLECQEAERRQNEEVQQHQELQRRRERQLIRSIRWRRRTGYIHVERASRAVAGEVKDKTARVKEATITAIQLLSNRLGIEHAIDNAKFAIRPYVLKWNSTIIIGTIFSVGAASQWNPQDRTANTPRSANDIHIMLHRELTTSVIHHTVAQRTGYWEVRDKVEEKVKRFKASRFGRILKELHGRVMSKAEHMYTGNATEMI